MHSEKLVFASQMTLAKALKKFVINRGFLKGRVLEHCDEQHHSHSKDVDFVQIYLLLLITLSQRLQLRGIIEVIFRFVTTFFREGHVSFS